MKKIILGSFAFVGLFNILFYPTVLGIGIGLLFFFFHLYLFVVRSKEATHVRFALLLSIISILFATLIGVIANGVVQTLDLLLAIFLSFVAGYFYKKETPFPFTIFSFLLAPLRVLVASSISINNFFSSHKLKKSSEKYTAMYNAIFRGVIIAVPILFILFFLLSSADPIFHTITSSISFSLSTQFVISLVLFFVCFVWGITRVKDALGSEQKAKLFTISGEKLVVESLIVTLSAATLFAVFLVIQLRYLFLQVPETELYQLGINAQTYSEYVRQGFFELLIAATIASSILAFVLQYLHRLITQHKLYVKIGMLFLTLETELLLLSAGKRLYLYEQAHGLTRSRFFGIVFLFWLSFILMLLFIAIVKKIDKKYFFTALLAITISAFVASNSIPVDALIATKYQPTINHEIDYGYIMGLSPETSDSWFFFITKAEKSWKTLASKKQPTDDEQRKVTELRIALGELNQTIMYLDKKYTKQSKNYTPVRTQYFSENQNTWQAFNISEYQAYQKIQKHRQLFMKVEILIKEIDKKQSMWIKN